MTAAAARPVNEAASACALPATGESEGGEHSAQLPLVALLRAAQDAYTAEFDARLARSEFCALSLAHSRNVLRHLADGPRRASQMVTECGVSKQALSQQIVHLESNGYLVARPDPTDQRARVLELTPRGRAAQRYVRDTFAEIERDWARVLGERDAASLRRVLTKLAGALPRPAG